MQWLKHAFAVDAPGPAEPNDIQRALVERLCQFAVRRRLTTPLLAFLEMSRPLNYLGAQSMHFLAPMATAFTDAEGYRQLAAFLEQRGSIDYFCRRLEHHEATAEGDDHLSAAES